MQLTEEDIKERVKSYILREFLPGESPDAVDDSTLLITGGVLDSIGTVKLVSFLEDEFGIELEAHELNAEYLNTIPDIARIVRSKFG
jgi:acyl carrier protein